MTEIDLSCQIGTQKFQHPFLNASGVHCQTYHDLDELMRTAPMGGVVTKSSTVHPRPGNVAPRYYQMPAGSINSMGLPNHGFAYYLKYALQKHQKPVIFSIAGITPAEDLKMLKALQDSNYRGLTELNVSCPNVKGKPQLAYDIKALAALLAKVFTFYKKPLGLKLPPFLDLAQMEEMALLLNQFPLTHVNLVNSVGNAMWVDVKHECTVIHPKHGFGGMGGKQILPIALANVRAFRQYLNPQISVIGTGGITTGKNVFAHILCGAEMVSVGTQLETEGPALFQRLTQELTQIMKAKGYHKLSDFRGKLKVLPAEN